MPKKNKKITVFLSEGDIDAIREGEQFDWTFQTQDGGNIDVLVRLETDEDL